MNRTDTLEAPRVELACPDCGGEMDLGGPCYVACLDMHREIGDCPIWNRTGCDGEHTYETMELARSAIGRVVSRVLWCGCRIMTGIERGFRAPSHSVSS